MLSNFFYIYPKILIPFGTIFNIINIILFSGRKLSKISLSFMIRLLAINHILNLITFGLWSFDGLYRQNLDSSTVLLCKVISTIGYLFIASNSWILVFISFNRLIMILFSRKPKIFRYKNFYVFISLIIYVYNILYYTPAIIFWDLEESIDTNMTFCIIPDPKHAKIIGFMDFVNAIMLPFVLMFFLSVSIIILLKKSKNKVIDISNLAIKKNNRNLKFSITILTLNFVFLFFMLPYAIAYILNDETLENFINFFMALYSSIDFFIYIATNSLFRETILSHFF